MKKTALIICVAASTCSLAAFGFMDWGTPQSAHTAHEPVHGTFRLDENPLDIFKLAPDPEFIYDVNPRFLATITKEKLEKAQSISDLVPEKATDGMHDFTNVKISVFGSENEHFALGTDDRLNPAQQKLLKSSTYSTNLYVVAKCTNANARLGKTEEYDFAYCITVVPEKQASYKYGQDGLLHYLKEKTYSVTKNVDLNQLKPGKIRFTINSEGQMEKIYMESSSGREELDKAMLDALRQIPQAWEPATNARGEKVDQELVFSYGSMGC